MNTCVVKTLVKTLDGIMEHEIYWHVLWKKPSFSCKPHSFLFFIVAQFHVKLAKK